MRTGKVPFSVSLPLLVRGIKIRQRPPEFRNRPHEIIIARN